MKYKDIVDSLIPLGMIIGGAVGVILGIFFESISQGFSIALGAGFGLLIGAIAYGLCS